MKQSARLIWWNFFALIQGRCFADPAAKEFKMVRIIAGNPLIMKRMAERVPDAASYAPVTILVSELEDGVHLSYDTMSSYLAHYGNLPALEVARDLDEKVISLLDHAAN